jgi:hypothetical protein
VLSFDGRTTGGFHRDSRTTKQVAIQKINRRLSSDLSRVLNGKVLTEMVVVSLDRRDGYDQSERFPVDETPSTLL